METVNWVKFSKGNPLPKERRYVLLQTTGSKNMPPTVAVGYLRIWSNGPWWVIPGLDMEWEVTHWCDCLGDDFEAPLWEGKQVK